METLQPQKNQFSIKDSFSKSSQIRGFLKINFLKKNFGAVCERKYFL